MSIMTRPVPAVQPDAPELASPFTSADQDSIKGACPPDAPTDREYRDYRSELSMAQDSLFDRMAEESAECDRLELGIMGY